MKIAIPVWDGKVSPVFDTASRLMVLEFDGGRELRRFEALLEMNSATTRCRTLQGLGVETLICGAITRQAASVLVNGGIRLIAWISGSVDEVLGAYLKGELFHARFLMPGCRHAGRGARSGGNNRNCPRRRGRHEDI